MRILLSKQNILLKYISGMLFLSYTLSSCVNTRQLVYMQGKFDTAKLTPVLPKEQTIQKEDLLSIIIYSDNPEATKLYNQALITTANPIASASSTGATSTLGAAPSGSGYLVDEKGDIEFQGLGRLHVEGLTKVQLRDTLDARLKDFLVNPYYNIRFLNYRFTMLGEIARPGIFSIPGEHINLLEALGLAGDMTFYGRRDNILVIRENNGKREWARLDITKPDIVASPYFYLQSNDVVIVEPTRKKVSANDQLTMRNISIATSIVSTLAILYSIFRK